MSVCQDCGKEFEPAKSGFSERHDTRCDQCRYLRKSKYDREYREAHPEKWKWHFLKERDLLRAYTAGFFDGEGWIFIGKHRASSTESIVGCGWSLKCGLVNLNLEVLQKIAKEYSGRIREDRSGRGRAIYRLSLHQQSIERFLTDIMPFLIVKIEQSKLALEFRDYQKKRYRHPYTDQDVKICEAYRFKIRELNGLTGKNMKSAEKYIPTFPNGHERQTGTRPSYITHLENVTKKINEKGWGSKVSSQVSENNS